MNVRPELKDARLTVAAAAELAHMHPAHFRRLVQRGVFPEPKKTAKGRPYFDYELLTVVAGVVRSGIGANGEETTFYRRQPGRRQPRHNPIRPATDRYIENLRSALMQLGIEKTKLDAGSLQSLLVSMFSRERPELAEAVARLAPILSV